MKVLEEYSEITYAADLEVAARWLGRYDAWAIATLGPEGSNSHVVARDIVDNLSETPLGIYLCPSFPEILTLSRRTGHLGILPLANRVGGAVRHQPGEELTNLEAIRQAGSNLLATLGLPIEHCLVSAANVTPEELDGMTVHSHPQALRQCTRYITKWGLKAVAADSTSAAAAALARSELGDRAVAIAPRLAGRLYDLAVISQDIGDQPAVENITTMAVISGGQ